MKEIILFFLFNLSITYANTQIHEVDSLKQLLQKEKTDTGRVLMLAELSRAYHDSKPDSALSLAMEALSLSRQIGFVKGEAVSLNRIGGAFGVLGNYPGEIQSYLEALKINERINNLDGTQRNLGNIGIFYRGQGHYRKALEYIFKAISIGKSAKS